MSSKVARSKGEKADGLPPDAVVIQELLASMVREKQFLTYLLLLALLQFTV